MWVYCNAGVALDHTRLPRSPLYDFRSCFLSESAGLVFSNLFWISFVKYFQHNSADIQETLTADVSKIFSILRRELDEAIPVNHNTLLVRKEKDRFSQYELAYRI